MIGSTEEGVPVIQCVILDNEEKRQLEQKLELENERYQAVAQMSDGVLWEYSAAEDVAIVPYSVRSVLVDQMRTPGFSDSAYAQGTVHPEDPPGWSSSEGSCGRESRTFSSSSGRGSRAAGNTAGTGRRGSPSATPTAARRGRSGARRTSTGKSGSACACGTPPSATR